MKKTRRAHLWIGLIASVFIFIEALSGLILNEPWLVGQSSTAGGQMMRGNFQQGGSNQNGGQGQGNFNNGQFNGNGGQNGFGGNGNGSSSQGQNGFGGNGQFQGQGGFGGNGSFMRNSGRGSGGLVGFIRNLHDGRIGNVNIKWLTDLIAIAMMVLTGTGIYLSINVLRAENVRNNRKAEAK